MQPSICSTPAGFARARRRALAALLLFAAASLSAQTLMYWRNSPSTSAWNTAGNWASTSGGTSGGVVPNSATVTAVFGNTATAARRSLTFNSAYTIAGMTFGSTAPGAFTFTLDSASKGLTFQNAGIVNNSGYAPVFNVSSGGTLTFNSGSAANATIAVGDPSTDSGKTSTLSFHNGATAASANIAAYQNGSISLQDTATLGGATVTINSGGALAFSGSASAGNATLEVDNTTATLSDNTSLGTAHVTLGGGGRIELHDNTTAGAATIAGGYYSELYLQDAATLGTANITLASTMAVGLTGNSTAGSATITAGDTSYIFLQDAATLGHAAVTLNDQAQIQFGNNSGTGGDAAVTMNSADAALVAENYGAGLSLGSLAGSAGTVYLNGGTLTVGSNDQSTTFSGTLAGTDSYGNYTNGALTKVGTGTLTLNGVINYYGDTTVSGGTIAISDPLTFAYGPVILAGGTIGFGSLTTATFGSLAGCSNLILANDSAGAVALTVGGNDDSTTYAGSFSGAGSLIKTGAGVLTLTGTNTQSGDTVLSAGALRLGSAGALSANSNLQFNGGVLELGAGAPTNFTVGTGAGQIQWTGDGGFGAYGGDRTVTLNGGAPLTWGVDGFMPGSTRLVLGSATSDSTLTFGNAIDLGAANRTVTVNDGAAALDAVLAGDLTGNGGLTKNGDGSLALTGNNTYSGATKISSGALRLGNGSSLPATSNIQFNGGVLELAAGAPTDFTTGTGAGEVQWLHNGGGFSAVGANRTVTLNGGTPLVWADTIGANNALILGSSGSDATTTFANDLDLGTVAGAYHSVQVGDGSAAIDATLSGVLSGAGALSKLGDGTLTLGATNTFTGGVFLGGGVLELSVPGSLGAAPYLELDGGTLRFASGFTGDISPYLYSYSGGAIDTNGNDLVFASAISSLGYAAPLTKLGAGSLTINGAGSYFSNLNVDTGSLTFGGAGTVTTGITVANGTNATAALTLTGAGTDWTANSIDVGNSSGGTGTLSVLHGATVNNSFSLDLGNSGTGNALVDQGTVTTGTLNVGYSAAGSLTIQQGGTVNVTSTGSSSAMQIGAFAPGSVTVTGANSQLNAGNLNVGYYSDGSLTIADGGVVNSGTVQAALAGSATATLLVTGANSQWNINSPDFITFNFGSGSSTLTVTDGATLNFLNPAGRILYLGGSTTLYLGLGGVGGTINGDVDGNGDIVVNNTDTSVVNGYLGFNRNFTKNGSGTLIATNGFVSATAFAPALINGGTLQVGTGGALETDSNGNPLWSGNVTLANGAAFVVNTSSNVTFNNSIGGTGSFTHAGTGTIGLGNAIFPNSNTYDGPTAIYAGVLQVATLGSVGGGASGLGSPTTAANGTIALGHGADTGTLSYTGGTATTNRIIDLAGTTGGGVIDLSPSSSPTVTFTGNITSSGTGAKTLTLTSGPGATGDAISGNISGAGTSLLLNGGGLWTLTGSNTFGGGITVDNAGLVFNGDSALGAAPTLNISGGGGLVYLTGNTTDISSRTITFTDGAASINIGTNNVTYQHAIGNFGAGGFIKFGTGTLTMLGANTYTGATTIAAGVLNAGILANGGVASGLGAASADGSNLLLSGGTLQYTGSGASTDRLFSITASSTLDASGTGAVSFTNPGTISGGTSAATLTLTGSNTGSNTIAGKLANGTGKLSLAKTGAGLWILNGANTYTGTTTISAGTLSVASLANGGSASGLGQSANAAANLIINGGTLQYTGGVQSTDRLFQAGATTAGGTATLDASGTDALTFSNTGALTFGTNNQTRNLVLTGTSTAANTLKLLIGNDGTGLTTLTKSGAGTWVLGGANTYTGVTTISGGVLSVASLANGGTASNLGKSTNVATNLVIDGGTLQYAGGTQSTDRLFQVGSATAGGTATLDASGTGALTFTNTGALAFGTANQTRSLVLTGASTAANTFKSLLGDNGTGLTALTKNGAGTWVLTAANTYTGGTTISAGTLTLSGSGTLGAATGSVTAAGGTLDLGGLSRSAGTITFSGGTVQNGTLTAASYDARSGSISAILAGAGTLTKTTADTLALTGANFYSGGTALNGGTLTVSADASLGDAAGAVSFNGGTLQTTADLTAARATTLNTGGGTFDVASATTLTWNGDIGGSGPLTKAGGGTLLLGGSNSYSGTTFINTGTLRLGAVGALSGNTTLQVASGATFDANGFTTTFNGLTGSGGVSVGSSGLTVQSSGSSTFDGALSGSGALTVGGGGTLVLTGASGSFSGPTTVTGSTLTVNGDIGGSAVTVGSGGIIGGNGTIGKLTLTRGSFISPGNSPGNLHTGDVEMDAGGGYVWQINNATGTAGTNWDLISISGQLTISATSGDPFTVVLQSLTPGNASGAVINFNPATNYSYTIASTTGGVLGFTPGAFTVNASGFTNAANGTWSLASNGASLNLIYTAIPEPATYAAILAGAALIAVAWRRRRPWVASVSVR